MVRRNTGDGDSEAAYQRFIDLGVETARKPSLYERLVRDGRQAPDRALMDRSLRTKNQRFNDLVQSLSTDQRSQLAELLSEERASAILSLFGNFDWLVSEGYGISKDGQQLDTGVYWDMSHDLSARLQGMLWPDEAGGGERMVRWIPTSGNEDNL